MTIDEPTGRIECYGHYHRNDAGCLRCRIKGYCRESRKADAGQRDRERTALEVPAALQKYAELPQVYDGEDGELVSTWGRVRRFLIYLLSLHPASMAGLKYKMERPDWSKERIARAMGISPDSLRHYVAERPAVAEAFGDRVRQRSGASIAVGEVVFLAGTWLAGEEAQQQFMEAETALVERFSCQVINPVFLPDLAGSGRPERVYRELGTVLAAGADAVVLLPGWEYDDGAIAAQEAASEAGRRVMLFDELRDGRA